MDSVLIFLVIANNLIIDQESEPKVKIMPTPIPEKQKVKIKNSDHSEQFESNFLDPFMTKGDVT